MGLTRALGWIGGALALGFVVRTALLGGVDDRGVLLAVAGAAALVAYAALDREELSTLARQRATRLGAGAVLLSVAAGLVAVLAYALVREVDRTFDATQDARHQLTSGTLAVIGGLDRDVQILGFFPDGSALQTRFEALARGYVEQAPRVTLELVDPLRQPLRARELGVRFEAGEVVVRAGERTERLVGRFDEDALTDAIARVSRDRDTVVCWSEGHGEADPDDTQGLTGMGGFVALLEGQSWVVRRVALARGAVPADCEALVVANPRSAWLAYEREALHAWLRGGGRALVLLEPGTATGLPDTLRAFGVAVGEDLVLDPDPAHRPMGVEDPSVLVLPPGTLRGHPITDGLLGAVTVGLVRSVAPIDHAPGVATKVLLRAGPQSWAEQALDAAAETYAPDEGELQGDVPLGVAVQIDDAAAVPAPGSTVPEVGLTEVEAALRRVLAAAGPALVAAPGTARLGADLGLDEDDQRLVALTFARTLGVELPPLDDPPLEVLVARAHAALATRLPEAAEAAVPEPRSGGRLVVIGDAGLGANRAVAVGSNRDVLENALAWLVGEEDRLGARPDDLGDVLELSARDEAAMALVALVLAPGIAGLGAWGAWRRRRGS